MNVSTRVKTRCIIRDKRGIYLESGQLTVFYNSTALESEFEALMMQNCLVKIHSRVYLNEIAKVWWIFSTKSLWILEYTTGFEKSHIGKIWFEKVQFKWVKRNKNQRADILAEKPLMIYPLY